MFYVFCWCLKSISTQRCEPQLMQLLEEWSLPSPSMNPLQSAPSETVKQLRFVFCSEKGPKKWAEILPSQVGSNIFMKCWCCDGEESTGDDVDGGVKKFKQRAMWCVFWGAVFWCSFSIIYDHADGGNCSSRDDTNTLSRKSLQTKQLVY